MRFFFEAVKRFVRMHALRKFTAKTLLLMLVSYALKYIHKFLPTLFFFTPERNVVRKERDAYIYIDQNQLSRHCYMALVIFNLLTVDKNILQANNTTRFITLIVLYINLMNLFITKNQI